jgi:hypothetical protein
MLSASDLDRPRPGERACEASPLDAQIGSNVRDRTAALERQTSAALKQLLGALFAIAVLLGLARSANAAGVTYTLQCGSSAPVSVVKPNDNAAIYTNGSTIYITAIGATKSDGKRTITSCSLHDQRLRADPVSNHQRLRVGSGDAHLPRPSMPAPSGVTCASVPSSAERSSPLSITRAALTLEPSQRFLRWTRVSRVRFGLSGCQVVVHGGALGPGGRRDDNDDSSL